MQHSCLHILSAFYCFLYTFYVLPIYKSILPGNMFLSQKLVVLIQNLHLYFIFGYFRLISCEAHGSLSNLFPAISY